MSQKSFFEGNASNSKKPPRIQSEYWKCNVHIKDGKTFDKEFESIEHTFRPLVNKMAFGEEYGDEGNTPHIEGYLWFKKKTEFHIIQQMYKFDDLQKSKKKWIQAGLDYCLKEGNKVVSVGMGRKLKKLACEDNMYKWEEDLCKIVENEPSERQIYWYWSESGCTGKTTFARYLHRRYGFICIGGKSADMKNNVKDYNDTNGFTPEGIVVNIPKSFNTDYICYTGLEEVKDMFFFSGKYEGGMIDGNPPHMIVFANEPPDTSKMSADRFVIRNVEFEDNYDFLDDSD